MSVNWDNVTWYTRTHVTSATITPSIKINKAGKVQITEAAIGLIGDAPEAFAVGLYSGRGGRVTLVLQAASKGDSGAMAVAKPATSKTYNLNMTKFLTDNKLESVFGSKALEVTFDADHKVLLVPLG